MKSHFVKMAHILNRPRFTQCHEIGIFQLIGNKNQHEYSSLCEVVAMNIYGYANKRTIQLVAFNLKLNSIPTSNSKIRDKFNKAYTKQSHITERHKSYYSGFLNQKKKLFNQKFIQH